MFNFDIDTQNYNLNGKTVEGASSALPTGWHKLELKAVGEEKLEKNGSAYGALFTFEASESDEYAGVSFNQWYCVQAVEAKAKWRQTVFENIIVRIAQCIGVERLTAVDQLIGKPFYAFVNTKEVEYESQETDRNGNFVKKVRQETNFNKGLLTEQFLSCAEFSEKNKPVELGDAPF